MDPGLASLLGGSLAGAVVAGLFVAWRVLHEDRRHFIDLKRERYAAFLRLSDQFRREVLQHVASIDDHLSGKLRSDQIPPLGTTDEIGHVVEEIGLLNKTVGDAARSLYRGLVTFSDLWCWRPGQARTGTHAQLATLVADYYNPERERFLELARRDLGTGDGPWKVRTRRVGRWVRHPIQSWERHQATLSR